MSELVEQAGEKKENELGRELRAWWRELQTNSGNKAALKRARTPEEAAFQIGYFSLLQTTQKIRSEIKIKKDNYRERLPVVAAVLAHIKADDPGRSAARAWRGSGGEKAVVSDLRFRRLLRVEEIGELMVYLIRLIRQVDGKVNIADIAEAILYWGDKTKRRWAEDYYFGGQLPDDNNEAEKPEWST